ncbi:cupin domain-containing protein [Aspergillus affinis]|uniref:cupin domain-containing protein n=1 Tax=Aspergillus affinis TaxID=1070780 RepID=UPI0022FE0B3A|nr:uncharacterized protein KD926_004081 [Aspergillus affinis]KAI9046243.1 hypothetical protein KD926_004081 [Aspergillus affinis]
MSQGGPVTGFPAPGLPDQNRYIVGHNPEGQSVFLVSDKGDHGAIMVEGAAAQNIPYSTPSNPVDLTDDQDVKFAMENKPPLNYPTGSVIRTIDFAPGVESNLHRSIGIGYGVVTHGVMELSLDSGEKRLMYPGDVSVNRAGMHRWRNVSESQPARMVYFLVGVTNATAAGKPLEEDLGYLAKEYV